MNLLYDLDYQVKQRFKRKIGLRKKILIIITNTLLDCSVNTINLFASYIDGNCELENRLKELLVSYAKTYNIQSEELVKLSIDSAVAVNRVCNAMQLKFNTEVYSDIDRNAFARKVLDSLQGN